MFWSCICFRHCLLPAVPNCPLHSFLSRWGSFQSEISDVLYHLKSQCYSGLSPFNSLPHCLLSKAKLRIWWKTWCHLLFWACARCPHSPLVCADKLVDCWPSAQCCSYSEKDALSYTEELWFWRGILFIFRKVLASWTLVFIESLVVEEAVSPKKTPAPFTVRPSQKMKDLENLPRPRKKNSQSRTVEQTEMTVMSVSLIGHWRGTVLSVNGQDNLMQSFCQLWVNFNLLETSHL